MSARPGNTVALEIKIARDEHGNRDVRVRRPGGRARRWTAYWHLARLLLDAGVGEDRYARVLIRAGRKYRLTGCRLGDDTYGLRYNAPFVCRAVWDRLVGLTSFNFTVDGRRSP